jgi:hypothetical protein
MERSFLAALFLALTLGRAALAEQIAVKHVQRPMHRSMTTRSIDGKVLASGEFTQAMQGDEVTMEMLYRFIDGSIDDETTTYKQQGTFCLVRNHHVQTGPFFAKQVDLAVDARTGVATSRTADKNGKVDVLTKHMDLPNDLTNGFIGTLLLNVPPKAAPFRVGMLVPVGGARLIRLLISSDGERTFQMGGQTGKAAVFRIHPELGGMVGMIAQWIGLQPKDVMVWVREGEEPAVVRIVGQMGGYGPVVSSELQGASFGR